MQNFFRPRLQMMSAIVVVAVGQLLVSCAAPRPVAISTSNPPLREPLVDAQTGELVVLVTDQGDGKPLEEATVDITDAAPSPDTASTKIRDYFRRTGTTDRNGKVSFTKVPRLVNVAIVDRRGTYSLDNYAVPPSGSIELHAEVETTGPRER